ncbi:hypothetical protein TRVA0_038S00936 [Trichomonascus vanleenenianus]|uniref:chromatin-modulating protein MRC1 n=1 Tax=Trichomonascus vanleenenianus TaxID=2268995 RepID=UPI003EC96940
MSEPGAAKAVKGYGKSKDEEKKRGLAFELDFSGGGIFGNIDNSESEKENDENELSLEEIRRKYLHKEADRPVEPIASNGATQIDLKEIEARRAEISKDLEEEESGLEEFDTQQDAQSVPSSPVTNELEIPEIVDDEDNDIFATEKDVTRKVTRITKKERELAEQEALRMERELALAPETKTNKKITISGFLNDFDEHRKSDSSDNVFSPKNNASSPPTSPMKAPSKASKPIKPVNVIPRRLVSFVKAGNDTNEVELSSDEEDDDLEIVPTTQASSMSKAKQKLVQLAGVNPYHKKSSKSNPHNQQALLQQLEQKQREQTLKFREERIAEIKARGGIVVTEEERLKEAEEVESILERERKKAEEIRKKEKAENGDDSEDEDFKLPDEEESEEEEREEEEDEGLRDEEELEEMAENESMEAGRDEDEDEEEATESNDEDDVPAQKRRARRVIIEEEDEDEGSKNIEGDEEQEEERGDVEDEAEVDDTQPVDLSYNYGATMEDQTQIIGSLDDTQDETQAGNVDVEMGDTQPVISASQEPELIANSQPEEEMSFPTTQELKRRYALRHDEDDEFVIASTQLSQYPAPTQTQPSQYPPPTPKTNDYMHAQLIESPEKPQPVKSLKSKPKSKFDKRKSAARGMADDEAVESDDEWAGLGGGSDDEGSDREGYHLENLVDDNTGETADEAANKQLYAERELARDNKQVEKLMADVTTGAWRKRKSNLDGYLDLSDNDDDEFYRRDLERREERKRLKMLEDEQLSSIANNPKCQAFIQSIADELTSKNNISGIDEVAEDDNEPQKGEQRPSEDAEEEERIKVRRRRLNVATIRESLSFLIENTEEQEGITSTTTYAGRTDTIVTEFDQSNNNEDDDEEFYQRPRSKGKAIDRISLLRSSIASDEITEEVEFGPSRQGSIARLVEKMQRERPSKGVEIVQSLGGSPNVSTNSSVVQKKKFVKPQSVSKTQRKAVELLNASRANRSSSSSFFRSGEWNH